MVLPILFKVMDAMFPPRRMQYSPFKVADDMQCCKVPLARKEVTTTCPHVHVCVSWNSYQTFASMHVQYLGCSDSVEKWYRSFVSIVQ